MRNLYRRYRPLRLEDVIGQEQVTGPLESSLKAGKISHAYLFVGPRGCGKTSVARILAHEVNGFKYEVEDDYVDIIEIDGASNRGIDNIRELREKVAIAPTAGKYKVYIIDEVHMLTKEAFNALLKTLEEPPEHAIFIMATTDAYKVPVTITSRAQTYTFKLADNKTMFDHLKKIAEKEKIAIDDDALEIIVKRGGGSYRDSLSLLDQISTLPDKTITKDSIIKALGLPSDDSMRALLQSYLSSNLSEISASLKDILSSGIKPETIAEELISIILENPQPQTMSLLSKLPEVKAPFPEAKLLVALRPEFTAESYNFSPTANVAKATKNHMSTKPSAPESAQVEAPAKSSSSLNAEAGTPAKASAIKQPSASEQPATLPQKDFNWDGFIDKINSLNDAIASQTKKCSYQAINNELHLYPAKSITRTILSRDNNMRILSSVCDLKIIIHAAGEKPANTKEDALLSKISGIMGGEVKNDGGENPF